MESLVIDYSIKAFPLPPLFLYFVESRQKTRYNGLGDYMCKLKGNYIKINYGGLETYGGNQRLSSDRVIKKCGCGIVAALDTLLYLKSCCGWTEVPELGAFEGEASMSGESYESCLAAMKRKYFPVLYPLGTNGMAIALGMSRFFKAHCLPYRAAWFPATAGMWGRMEKMLEADIPVVCAVGTNFPKFWEKKGLALQVPGLSGGLCPSADARAHFVTVTGLDKDWMQISSWGKKYHVSRRDFISYARGISNPLLCGILYIERK